jgi:hypothetical protein
VCREVLLPRRKSWKVSRFSSAILVSIWCPSEAKVGETQRKLNLTLVTDALSVILRRWPHYPSKVKYLRNRPYRIRDAGVAGSNPVVPTIFSLEDQGVSVRHCTLIFLCLGAFGTFLAPFSSDLLGHASSTQSSSVHPLSKLISSMALSSSSSETLM